MTEGSQTNFENLKGSIGCYRYVWYSGFFPKSTYPVVYLAHCKHGGSNASKVAVRSRFRLYQDAKLFLKLWGDFV